MQYATKDAAHHKEKCRVWQGAFYPLKSMENLKLEKERMLALIVI
jgi:hypothetical protein